MAWGQAHMPAYAFFEESYPPIKYLLKAPYVSGIVSGAGKIAKNKIVKIPALMEIDMKQDKGIKVKVC